MMRSVFLKTLYDKRVFMIGWALGFMALAALMSTFFPAMRPEGGIDQLLMNLPAAFEGLIGDLGALRNYDTYIASQLFDIRVPLIAGIMAIILGIGLSASEEETGELRTLTSLPISRTKLLFEKWLAMSVILIVISLGLAGGIYATLPFVEDAAIDVDVLLRLLAMTWLVMITYGTIPFALGFATGKRGVATGVSILVIIGSFLLSTFGQAVDWLSDYEKLSLLYYFPAIDIAKDTIQLVDALVYVGLTVLLLVIAFAVFRRRDVA